MNVPVEWVACLRLLAVMAAGGLVVVGLVAILQSYLPSALRRRAWWRAAVLGLGLLFVAEVSGLAYDLSRWLRTSPTPPPSPPPALPLLSSAPPAISPRLTDAAAPPLKLGAPRPARPMPATVMATGGHDAEPFLQHRTWPWPHLVWSMGTAAVLAVLGLRRLVVDQLFRRNCRCVNDANVLERVSDLARRLGMIQPVRVLQSARLKSPVAFGVLRPTVGLPVGFAQRFDLSHQQVMLAHELAHLSGRDQHWQAVADLVAALLWWHPFAWWARHRLRAISEMVADDASALIPDGPATLAECLVHLATELAAPSGGGLAATGPGFRSQLGRRIERLLARPRPVWPIRVRKENRWRAAGGGIALALGAVLSTGWAGPQHHGGAMKTLTETWRRSIATLALFGAAHSGLPNPVPALGQAHPDAAVTIPDRRDDPRSSAAALSASRWEHRGTRYALNAAEMPTAGGAGATAQTTPAPSNPPAAEAESKDPSFYRMDPRLLERYGLKPRGGTATVPSVPPTAPSRTGRGKQQIEAKLTQIILDQVTFDAAPLGDVVKLLQDEARRRDPAKQGMNFLLSNVPEGPASAGGVDPSTGMPLPSTAVDLANVTIRLQLSDVRLKDVLDAMTRVADHPIRYSVEEYGIVFSPGSGLAFLPATLARMDTPRLQVRTFRVDTNSFLAGLESAFGIRMAVEPEGPATQSALKAEAAELRLRQEEQEFKNLAERHAAGSVSEDEFAQGKLAVDRVRKEAQQAKADARVAPGGSRDVQQGLRQLLQQLGINLEVANKAVFYNELTGIVMVRATSEDLELVEAAIETLGGKMLRANAPRENQNKLF